MRPLSVGRVQAPFIQPRFDDLAVAVFHDIAARLTDADMRDLASYIQGMR